LIPFSTAHAHHPVSIQAPIANPNLTINSISPATRAHWMRRANAALLDVTGSPCPFGAFGSVIVNHTDTRGLGQEICIGANSIGTTGNPTLHGGQHIPQSSHSTS
jgi:hypothetical protein